MVRLLHWVLCGLVLVFLIAPVLVVVVLGFNAESCLSFAGGMLRLDADVWPLRWYEAVLSEGGWARALFNGLMVGAAATVLATILGVFAALGLTDPTTLGQSPAARLLISPMITLVIVSAAGLFFLCVNLGLADTPPGLVLAHAALGTPFVLIAVTAALTGFNHDLTRAAAGLGAGPWHTFRRVQLPLILPGVVVGALFAFATSFHELVAALSMGGWEKGALPERTELRAPEWIGPEIPAVGALLFLFPLLFLGVVEWLRRRGDGGRMPLMRPEQ